MTSNNFQIFFLGAMALIALTSAEPEPEPYYGYGVWGSYHDYQHAWKHSVIQCNEATCTICNEAYADHGPIFATNCLNHCRQCTLCDWLKTKGLFNEVPICEKYCASGISACIRNCLQDQQKCLACAPQCGKL